MRHTIGTPETSYGYRLREFNKLVDDAWAFFRKTTIRPLGGLNNAYVKRLLPIGPASSTTPKAATPDKISGSPGQHEKARCPLKVGGFV